MDFASETVDIGHLFEVEVLNPVLDVLGPPEGNDDSVSRG